MIVPGGNILNMALSRIARQEFKYFAFRERRQNQIGQDIAVYREPVSATGSVQPMRRELFEKYGLDFQCNYITVFTSRDVIDIGRDVSGDEIEYAGKVFKCLSETDWFSADGWVSVLCVEIKRTEGRVYCA